MGYFKAGVLVCLLLVVGLSTAVAQSADVRLQGCAKKTFIRPTSVTLTCADGGVFAHDLSWSGWGTGKATASGVATVETCEPDCATGGTLDYPVVLTADLIKTCRDGSRRYTRLRYDWPQTSPFPPDAPGSTDPYVNSPCPFKKPRISKLSFRLVSSGKPGPNYRLKVKVSLRVCAPKQKGMELVVLERQNPDTFRRNLGFSHRGGCRNHKWSWSLRDEFFGVGTYSVSVRVLDSQGQFSSRLTRKGKEVLD